jgi:hypothetical protein
MKKQKLFFAFTGLAVVFSLMIFSSYAKTDKDDLLIKANEVFAKSPSNNQYLLALEEAAGKHKTNKTKKKSDDGDDGGDEE